MQSHFSTRRSSIKQDGTCRSGLAVLEFAMVTPLLLLLLLGVAEFAQAIFVTETLTSAARQGSRMGAQSTATPVEIEGFVKRIVAQELDTSESFVDVDVVYSLLSSDLTQDDMCRVEVSIEANQVGLGFSRMLADSRLQAHAAARCQTGN
jgi:Flp pilus assembly protein TadG